MTTQFNRTAIYISLGLSIALVFAVILGAKHVFSTAASAPVAISPVGSEHADSPECAALVDSLPPELMGLRRAEVAEPVPAGTAAWSRSSTETATLRCGVDLPQQYTPYSQTQEIDGAEWLQVHDETPGSTMSTWYTVDRFPAVAVTATVDGKPEGLRRAFSALREEKAAPHSAPLSELPAGPAAMCAAVEDNLPESIAPDYARRQDVRPRDAHTYVWSAPGSEDIVVRCGVAAPANYRPGAQLQQVNSIPWFEDASLASGSTAGTWYGLGRSDDIALYAPQAAADSALVRLSDVLAAHTPAQ